MANQKSEFRNQKSEIVFRLAGAGLIVALSFAIGHYGLLPAIVERGATGRAGRALENIPAPPESQLAGILNSAPGSGRVLVRYVSRESADAVAEFYRHEMPARGWTTQRLPGMMEEPGGMPLTFADPTGSWCIISIVEAGAGGGSAVTLMRQASVPNRGPAAAGPKEEMQ